MGIRDGLRALFGTKASATAGTMTRVFTVGQAAWTPCDFEKMAKEGFKTSVYVYRSISMISQGAAGVPWIAYRLNGGRSQKAFSMAVRSLTNEKKRREYIKAAIARKELVAVDGHAILDLLSRPNPLQGGSRFMEALIAFYELAGNTYVEAVGPDNRPPMELYTLRPDKMKIIVGNSVEPIAGYEFSQNGSIVRFPVQRVLHVKTFDPLDDWYGQPPLQAAFRSVDQNNAAKGWNVAMFQNGAQPSGAVVSKQPLSDAQFKRLKDQIGSEYSGYRNAGKPLLLENDLDWRQMGLSPVDMSWLEGQKLSAREIGLAFGVPSQLLGDNEASTYSNYQEARKALYQETILPLLDLIRDELNNWLTPMFDDRLFLDYDADSIEALQENRDAAYKRVGQAFTEGWLKLNEARTSAGFDEVDGGDVFKWQIDAALRPMQVPQQGKATAFILGKNSDSCCEDHGMKAEVIDVEAEDLLLIGAPATKEDDAAEAAKVAFWSVFEKKRETFYDGVQKQVEARFAQEADAVLKAVDGLGDDADQAKVDAAIAKALKGQAKAWLNLYLAIYQAVGKPFGDKTADELATQAKAMGRPFERKDGADAIDFVQVVTAYIEEHGGDRIEDISASTRAQLGVAIAEGFAAGESIRQIAARLRALYDDFAGRRAVVIARTEVINASNAGSWASAMATGLPLDKEWIATRDQRVRGRDRNRRRDRYSHLDMDGQRVASEAPFIEPRRQERLLWPGDYSMGAQAGNVIQCRCTVVYHIREED